MPTAILCIEVCDFICIYPYYVTSGEIEWRLQHVQHKIKMHPNGNGHEVVRNVAPFHMEQINFTLYCPFFSFPLPLCGRSNQPYIFGGFFRHIFINPTKCTSNKTKNIPTIYLELDLREFTFRLLIESSCKNHMWIFVFSNTFPWYGQVHLCNNQPWRQQQTLLTITKLQRI